MTAGAKRSGSRALVLSVVLGVLALGGGVSALSFPERAVMAALAISACVAFASMIAALISFGGRRPGASLAALAASLVILLGLGAGFGAVSVQRFVEAVERRQGRTQSHEDSDFGFRLTAPSPDTIVYSERALRAVNERAAAGMWLPDEDMTVLVFAELPYDRSLEVAAREELRLISWEQPVGVTEARVRYLDRGALRIQRTFGERTETLYEESTFFFDRGLLYCVQASRALPTHPAGSPWFPEALDALELLDGEVRPRVIAPAVASDDGPGWRVRGSIYENADFGVRVRGTFMHMRYGEAAHLEGPDAILVLEDRHPDVILMVAAVPTGGRDPAAVARELEETPFGDRDVGAPLTVDVNGRAVVFDARIAEPNRTWRYRYGVWLDEERVIEIAAWAPTRALVDEALGELASRVEILDERETLALRRELGERPDAWHGVGHDWAIRDGVLTDFTQSVRWRRPDPSWSARVSDVTDGAGADEIMVLDAPSLGLRGVVTATDARGEPAAVHHQQLVSERHVAGIGPPLSAEDAAGTPRRFGDAEGMLSARVPSLDHAYALGTVTADDVCYRIEVWGTQRDFDAHAASALAAVEAFAVSRPAESARFEGSVYRDERMGFAFRSPWPDEPQSEWTSLGAGVGSLVHFGDDVDSVAIMAEPRDPTTTAEDQTAFLMRDYYAHIGYSGAGWRDEEATLGGRPCRLRARTLPFGVASVRVYRLVADGVLYVVVINDAGRTDLARAADGFRLL